MCTQEAVPVEENAPLLRLFSPDVLGRLPSSGPDRVRRTMLQLIGNDLPCDLFEVSDYAPPCRSVCHLVHDRRPIIINGGYFICCDGVERAIALLSSGQCPQGAVRRESNCVGTPHKCIWIASCWYRIHSGESYAYHLIVLSSDTCRCCGISGYREEQGSSVDS